MTVRQSLLASFTSLPADSAGRNFIRGVCCQECVRSIARESCSGVRDAPLIVLEKEGSLLLVI